MDVNELQSYVGTINATPFFGAAPGTIRYEGFVTRGPGLLKRAWNRLIGRTNVYVNEIRFTVVGEMAIAGARPLEA